MRDLCRHYGHDLKTLLKLFRGYGIQPRNSFEAWKVRRLTKTPPRITRDALYDEYFERGLYSDAIGKAHNIPARTVRRYLKRYGIPLRPKRFPFADTSIEKLVEEELARREIGYYKQYRVPSVTTTDEAFPFEKIAVFCDGDYWHSLEPARERDARVNAKFAAMGWVVLRFTEHQINTDVENVVDAILKVLVEKREQWAQDQENGKKSGI